MGGRRRLRRITLGCAWAVAALGLALSAAGAGPAWSARRSGTEVRFRGLSVASASVAWASGEKGTFARTTDGGRTWRVGTVPGAEALDFRDVDAFGASTAYLLAIGPGEASRIYKTVDGGANWSLQFTNRRPDAFFDAMAFWDAEHGIAFSDPVDGRFLVITTADGGRTWEEAPRDAMPPALEGEGGFAASGTSIAVAGTANVWFGTGGPAARVFHSSDRGKSWEVSATPIASGAPSRGIFSLAFRDALHGVAVGGDYRAPADARATVAVTQDGGRTWALAGGDGPPEYRSCVAYVPEGRGAVVVAVGPTGSDYSTDGGATWTRVSTAGFHATGFTRGAGWGAGEGGRLAKFVGTPDLLRLRR